MTLNSAGLQIVYDFGVPKTISGKAREAISGGELVFTSGANNVVSSGANSFDPETDLLFATAASGTNYVGIALAQAGSNDDVTVAREGVFLITANGTVTASTPVIVDGNHSVADFTEGTNFPVGRALTSAASGGFALIHLGGL